MAKTTTDHALIGAHAAAISPPRVASLRSGLGGLYTALLKSVRQRFRFRIDRQRLKKTRRKIESSVTKHVLSAVTSPTPPTRPKQPAGPASI
jgi:hypothetical protein